MANHLDPDKTYIMDQRIVDVDKTVLEIVPKSKAHLAEAELIIETSPLDLETRHEIRYDPILKPIEKPFRALAFNPKTFDISMKIYPDSAIKNLNLDDFSDASSAYCNTPKNLYISGGKGKANKYFWKINKQNYSPDKMKDLLNPKEEHTMFFVPKKYIYFIGGNSQETFMYNISKDSFEEWGPLKKKRIKPCVALANKTRLYVFDSQPEKKNVEFIEKCNLAKGRQFELLKVSLSEPFTLTNFSAAVDYSDKIYLFGGKKKDKEKAFMFDPKDKSLVPFEQENTSLFTNSDKSFLPINDYNAALIPNIEGDKINVLVFNRRRKRFRKLKFNPEVEEFIEIKDIQNKDGTPNDEKMKLMLKRVADQEKMPDLPEGLIRFPTLEELKAPPKEEPELKIEINPPSLNVDVPKIEGEIGLPDAGIEGPKIEGEIGLPGIDIQGPKIEAGIGLPGMDINGPK